MSTASHTGANMLIGFCKATKVYTSVARKLSKKFLTCVASAEAGSLRKCRELFQPSIHSLKYDPIPMRAAQFRSGIVLATDAATNSLHWLLFSATSCQLWSVFLNPCSVHTLLDKIYPAFSGHSSWSSFAGFRAEYLLRRSVIRTQDCPELSDEQIRLRSLIVKL